MEDNKRDDNVIDLEKRKRAEDEREIKSLAGLDPVSYEREREGAAKALGMRRVTALDKLVLAKRKELNRPPPEAGDAPLAEMNLDHSVVKVSGVTRVLVFEDIPHKAGGREYALRVPSYMRFRDFRDFYLNHYTIDANGRPYAVDRFGAPLHLGDWWLDHPGRAQYAGVVFIPGKDAQRVVDGYFNLWSGFGVEPKQGDWSKMREHIRVILAAGDEAFFQYVIRWLADAVQHPDRQSEVALVFIGEEGVGKGLLGRAMCRIFGRHSLHISSAEHFAGKFNAHLQQTCFLFADEAVAPQDKRAEGAIKRLITEETNFIEPKGVNGFSVPNYLHTMIASNHNWVVQAGERARRYVVQTCSDAHIQDKAWMKPIYDQMDNGGLEAMLFDLLNMDLGDWHPREIVRTAALAAQQEESLSPLDQWMLDLLETGVLPGRPKDAAPDEAVSCTFEEKVTVSMDNDGKTVERIVMRPGLYDHARQTSPKLKTVSNAALARYLRDFATKPPGVPFIPRAWVHRRIGWRFPPLAQCRDKWIKRFPETVWPDPSPAEWTIGEDDED